MALYNARALKDVVEKAFAGIGDATSTAFVVGLLTKKQYLLGTPAVANTIATPLRMAFDTASLLQVRVTSVQFVPNTALTAANTNVATLSVVYNNGNGGSDTTVASINTATTAGGGSGNWTAGIPVSLTINGTNAVVPVGSTMSLTMSGSGAAGTAVGIGSLVVKCDPE